MNPNEPKNPNTATQLGLQSSDGTLTTLSKVVIGVAILLLILGLAKIIH